VCTFIQTMAFCNKQSSLVGKEDLSPLATKLQQAWLQSQLFKVQKNDPSPFSFSARHKAEDQTDVEPLAHKLVFSHIIEKHTLPPLYSHSTKDSLKDYNLHNHGAFSHKASTNVGDGNFGGDSEPNMMTFLNEILMEEDIDDEPCMQIECTVFQAMENEFADLIREDSLSSTSGNKNFENNMVHVGGVVDYNKTQNIEPSGCTQLYEQLFEDDLVHEYTDMLCQDVSQLNYCNNMDIITTRNPQSTVSMHPASNFSTSNKVDEHGGISMATCLPCGDDKGVQCNVNFAFEFGDEDHLPELLFKCGEAIGQNDLRKATQIIVELRELSSPNGSGVQRMAHYVTDALVIFL
jgi:hypothetical protein